MKVLKNFILILLFISNINIFGQIITTEKGTIEFVGLQNWKAQDLLDSLNILHPNKPIAACAATLKSRLGFADASVLIYMDDNSKPYTVVTLIESNLSNRIKFIAEPLEKVGTPAGWNQAIDLILSNQILLQATIMTYGLYKTNQIDSANSLLNQYPININDVKIMWKFLQNRGTKNDKQLALWTIENDQSFPHRAIALSILINFHSDDDVWWNLMKQQRSENHRISSIASSILEILSDSFAKDVYWAPAVNSIKHIINGTNPFAFLTTLKVLQKTNFPQNLCMDILNDKPNLLTFYLEVQHQKTKNKIFNFLSQISGFKYDKPEDWKKWINQF